MVGSEGSEGIAGILRRGAASRGVSLALPLLDMEDRVAADPPESWTEAEERLRVASGRYRPGSILIGRVRDGVLSEARWSLLLPDGAQRWSTEGGVVELVVEEGVQKAINALAGHYTSPAPETGGATIVASVSGVHDFAGYTRTMRYLESLDEVESVEVLAVVSGRVRIGLKLRTGVSGLRDLIALGSTLAEDIGGRGRSPGAPAGAVIPRGDQPGGDAPVSADAAQLPLRLALSRGRAFSRTSKWRRTMRSW